MQRSRLRSVFIEGKTDAVVFRDRVFDGANADATVIPLGGRDPLLEVYRRRAECLKPTVFVADQDLWVYSGRPEEYSGLVLTDGYSIENDIFRDGNLLRLCNADELAVFKREVAVFCEWYSSVLSAKLNGAIVDFSRHPNAILDSAGRLTELAKNDIRENGRDRLLEGRIYSDFERLVRGKSLLQLLLRRLSDKARESKYSSANLMEIGSAAQGVLLARMLGEIMKGLDASG